MEDLTAMGCSVAHARRKPSRIDQAVVFVGGQGTRLRPITDRIPKPLAPVNGAPFLSYLFQALVDVGIRKILLLAGYKVDQLVRQYGESLPNGVQIEYSVGTVEDQTGRRLLNAYSLLDPHFLLLYGDNYWPIALNGMLELFRQSNVAILTTVFRNARGTGEYGFENNVEVGAEQMVWRYDRSRKAPGLNGVDIGFFIVQKDTLDPGLPGNVSFEEDILACLVQQRQVTAWVTDVQYYYITDPDSLRRFEAFAAREHVKHI